MDKETLSNYGWIVICVLVLAVMIALATPFGDYISTAVKSTTQGLFDTNKNALNSTGLINIGDQSFSDGTGDSGGGNQTTEVKREAGSIIPNGAKYTIKATNTVLEGNGTNTFPDAPAQGDTYEEGDYKYTYNKGDTDTFGTNWSVRVIDKSKETYETIITSVAGKPVTHMFYTYGDCVNLVEAPAIPNGIVSMECAFINCSKLDITPNIPDTVVNLSEAFEDCTLLTTIQNIPKNAVNLYKAFAGCSNISEINIIIPKSADCISMTFYNCTNLTGTIEIHTNTVNDLSWCFKGTTKSIRLTGSSTRLDELAATSSKGNVTVAQ